MRFRILLLLMAAAFVFNASAEKVRVVSRDVQPFAFQADGKWTGFAMELWDKVAAEMALEYDVTAVGTPKEMVEAVQNKSAEVGVGALSITAEREKIIDFSQPFYESGLQILVSNQGSGTFGTIWSTVSPILNWKFLGSFALLIFAMLVISHLVWMYEHKINEEMWPQHYVAGMWESFWWTISTLLVGGADNKGPVGVGGRIVAIVWMLLSIVLVALLTASFTATLTINTLNGDIKGPGDLPGKTVATIGGSTAETWLKAHKVPEKNLSLFPTIQACIDALKEHKVKAVVYDAPILKYAVNGAKDEDLILVPGVFSPGNYGFALQQDSPLRERLNQALLTLSENGTIQLLREKYFGKDE